MISMVRTFVKDGLDLCKCQSEGRVSDPGDIKKRLEKQSGTMELVRVGQIFKSLLRNN